MDTATALEIREQIVEFVNQLAADYGLSPKVGAVSFGQYGADIAVNFSELVKVKTTASENVSALVPHRFLRDGHKFGITAKDFNRKFMRHGVEYRIVGVSPRAKKYPVVIERVSDGVRLKSTLRDAFVIGKNTPIMGNR